MLFIGMVFIMYSSCDLSGILGLRPKNTTTEDKDKSFGIDSVRFYKNLNVNMQGPDLYPDTEYIEAKKIDNYFFVKLKYQVFRKNTEVNYFINPTIEYNGDSIAPNKIAPITSERTKYVIKKGKKSKIYYIEIMTTDDSIPISFDVRYDMLSLNYMDTNVWGVIGLPWDVQGMRGKQKSVAIRWHGDIDFPFTSLSLPSKTKFKKNGREYTFELRIEKIPIEYPIFAVQNSRQLLIQDNVLYVLPQENAFDIKIEFYEDAIINNINNGEFDSHVFRESKSNTLTYTKNNGLDINYNKERSIASFDVSINGNKKTYQIVLRKYAGDTITFFTEKGEQIFPKENYVQVSFLRQEGYSNVGRYIPSGKRIITIETAQNFNIIVNSDDQTQYRVRDKNWMTLYGRNDCCNYGARSNSVRYKKRMKSSYPKYDSSFVTRNKNKYTVNIDSLFNTHDIEILKIAYDYTDYMSYNEIWESRHRAEFIARSGVPRCNNDYQDSCYSAWGGNKRIPGRGIVRRQLGIPSSESSNWIPGGTYRFTKTVETIIYYKRP